MKDESKKINFKKLPKKLLSCLLALVMLVGMVQVAFTVSPVASAAWTDYMGTLNNRLFYADYYNKMYSYSVTNNSTRNRVITDLSGNSAIWNIAVAFQDIYWALVNEAPGHYPEWYLNTIWNSGAAQYAGAYDLMYQLVGGGFYRYHEDDKQYDSIVNLGYPSEVNEDPGYVTIVRDTDCALRDYLIRNVNDLPGSVLTSFYYAWASKKNSDSSGSKLKKKYYHWSSIEGGINGWQSPQYADTSSVQYLKNYINYFFNISDPSIWYDFGTILNSYDQNKLYDLAVNANNNYYPIGNVSWNVVYYWVMLHGSGLWGAVDVTNGNAYDAIDNYWRFQVTGQDMTPYYNNANNIVNQIPAYVTNVNNAYQAKAYVPYVDYINTVRQPGYYNTEDITTMQDIYNNVTNYYYNVLSPVSDTVKNVLATYNGYDAAATEAFISQLAWDINTYYIRSTKNNIDTYMYQYYGANEYTDEQKQQYGVVYNTRNLDDNTVTWLRDSMQSFSDTIDYYWQNGYSTYIAQLFAEVGTDYYHNYISSLNWEINRRGADTNYGAYYGYFVPKMVAPYATYSTADLEATIGADVGTQINFNNDFNYFVSLIGATATNEAYRPVFNTAYANFNQETNGYINTLFDVLNNRLIAEIDPLLTFMAPYNNTINVENFSQFKSMRKNIEDGIYTWLSANYPDRISQELAQKYASLQFLYAVYDNFMNTWSPDKIEKVDLSGEYPVRPGTSSDYARKEGEDFAVTKENLTSSISKLDNFLYSEDFAKLLKLEEEGTNVNNLSSYIDSLLGESVFNNEMMNTLVAALIPMLQETLEKELKKAVADNNPYSINVQTEVLSQDATVTGQVQFYIDTDLKDGQQKQNDLPTLFKQLGLYVYPNTFAEALSAFPEIQNALYSAGRNWNAFADADGDVEFNFDWGIDNLEGTAARYERFKQVLSTIFEAVLPVLKTLLGTSSYSRTASSAVYAETTEKLRAYVKLFGSNIEIASSNLKANADLDLKIEGVDLFRKVWIPVMEALGLNTTEHPYNFGAITDTSSSLDVVNAMFGPVYELINELVSSPISRVVEMIPNLAYMVSFDKLSDLFNMNINLSYTAKLKNTDASNDLVDGILKLGFLDELIKGDLSLDVADVIDVNDLLGFDTSDFNSILSFVLEKADLGEVALQPLNIGKYMSYATVNTNYQTQRVGSQRVYFTADKADVFFAFIKELVSALGNQGFIDNIIDALNSNRTNPIELSDDILGIINSLNVNTNDAVCAVIELLNPQSYAFEDMKWFDMGEYDAIDGVTPASVAYLNYGNNWTKDKAEYIAENIDEIVASVLEMAKADETDVRAALTSVIKNAFTNKTITSVMKTFVKFGDALDETLSGLISDETGVDLTLWANAFGYLFDENAAQGSATGLSKLSCVYDSANDTYTWSFDGKAFEDGDISEFTDILCYILEGISPLVSFILTGENISLFANAVTAKGYKGYGEAIPYLFEALGVENVYTQAQYEAAFSSDPTAGLNYIITTLLSRVDEILENPVSEILDIIPGIVYYLESNGLSTAIKALLKPVLVLIDTIRPIYSAESIDPNSIVKNLIADLAEENPDVDIEALRISIDDLSLEKIIEIADAILEAKSGIEIKEVLSPAVRALCNTKVAYTSAGTDSTAYTVKSDRADTITVIITTILEVLQYGNNAAAFDEFFETDGLLPSILNLFNSTVSDMMEPNWIYSFEAGTGNFDYNDLPSKTDLSQFHTVNYLEYDNDWSEKVAKYFDENLENIILEVFKGRNPDAEKVSDLIEDLEIYSAKTVASLAGAMKKLVSDIDPVILNVLGKVIEADLSAVTNYSEDEADYNVTDSKSFCAEITKILAPVEPVLSFMLLGKDIRYATSSGIVDGTNKGDDIINLQGAEGYAYGIVPLLEALGCEPKAASKYIDADGNADSMALLEDVLNELCSVIDGVMDDPINKILELIPNAIYYVNAGGLTVTVNNTLAALSAIIDSVNEISDKKLDLEEIIGFSIDDLSFNFIFDMLQKATEKKDEAGNLVRSGLNLNSTIGDTISKFYVGEIEYFTSANGRGSFRMSYNDSEDRKDMITILVCVLSDVIKDSANAAFFKDTFGEDAYSTIISLLGIDDVVFTYETPDWAYMYDGDVSLLGSALPQREGNSYANYTKYTNNWNEETATYVRENLQTIVDAVISSASDSDTTIGVMLENAMAGNVYKNKVLNSLLEKVVELLADADSLIVNTAGVVLSADIDTWFSWCEIERDADGKVVNVTCTKDWGIDTAADKKAAFIDALTEALAPANRVLAWFLLGENYTFLNDKTGEDVITIKGGEGYNYAIVPLLEALGCEVKPAATYLGEDGKYDVSAVVAGVITALCDKVTELCGDNTIDVVLDILLNAIYFINADGISVSVKNLLVPVEHLLERLQSVIGEVDLEEAIGFPVKNITFETIFDIIADSFGINLRPESKEFIETFYMGQVNAFASVGGETAYRMTYSDEETSRDMMTILLSLLLENVIYEENEAALKDLLGEDTYKTISNLFNTYEFDMQKISWMNSEYADTDTVFSAMNTTEIFSRKFGPLFTEEMALYIADNFDEFINTVISVLGIQIDGETMLSIEDILEGLIGTTVYTTENAQKILDAFKGFVARIDEMPAGAQLKGVLKKSLGVDLGYYDTFEITEFEGGSREGFANAITGIVKPLFPLLKWFLCEEDLAFFTDKDGQNLIKLYGSEGYKYGVIPVLEALMCENIKSEEEYYSDIAADEDNMIKDIVNPILDKIDVVLADPANEIFNLLPNIFYFINSNGLDTCWKNALHSLYGVLDAIKPMVDVDLYELINIKLDEMNFRTLGEYIFDIIDEKTGYKLDAPVMDSIVELTTGKIVSFDSLTGEKAYRMIYAEPESKAVTATLIMRLIIRFIGTSGNGEKIKAMIKSNENVSADAYKFYAALIDMVYAVSGSELGMDSLLYSAYWIFYGLRTGFIATDDWMTSFNGRYKLIYSMLLMNDNQAVSYLAEILLNFFEGTTKDVIDEDGLASSGLVPFFQKIINWFKQLFESIRNLFK